MAECRGRILNLMLALVNVFKIWREKDGKFKLIVLPELQKAFNLPPSKIFKVCKPSSKRCKVGLSKLKIRLNLENEFSGIDHLLIFLC